MMRRTSSLAVRAAGNFGAESPSTALVTLPPRAASDVTVSLWRLRSHLDGRRAKYALHIDNRGADPLESLTYTFAPERAGKAGAPVAMTAPGFTSLDVKLTLALPGLGTARAMTEIRTPGGTLVFAESERPRSKSRPAVWLGASLAALAIAAQVFGSQKPVVAALAAPSDVPANRPFSVAYVLGHADAADYTVVSAHGFVAASGALTRSEGGFDVALPFATAAESYDIQLTARGRLGIATRTVRVVAEAGPPPPVIVAPAVAVRPRAPAEHAFGVDRLTLASNTLAGGKPIVVYYRVASADGMLRLIDQYGTVRAEALLDRRGNSILLAPHVDADQDFRVVLHASRGNAQAEKSVALRITKERSLDDVLAAARRKNDGPIALVKQTVAPGDPIEIGIVSYRPGMRVALVDPQGQEVAGSAVVDDQNEITMTAPVVAGTARYTVTATFMNGVAEETVIRSLTIGGAVASHEINPL